MLASQDVAGGVLVFWISVMVALIGWRLLVKPLLNDLLRQRIFELRRELFLFMADGYVSCDHPAYTSTRTMLNALLRRAESFTLERSLLGAWGSKRLVADYRESVEQKISTLPIEAQGRLIAIREASSLALAKHVFLSSPLGWAVAIIVTTSVLTAVMLRRVKPKQALWAAVDKIEAIEVEAEILCSAA